MTTNSKIKVSTLTDAHIEPTVFRARGATVEVLNAIADAISREQLRDVTQQGNNLKMGQVNAALAFGEDTANRFAYTQGAYTQFVEKMSPNNLVRSAHEGQAVSPTKFGDVAMWANAKETRATLHREMLSLARASNKAKRQTFRLGTDAHNPDPTRRVEYLRAVVSERHSAETGDDKAFFTEFGKALDSSYSSEFNEGKAYVERDPAGATFGHVDSAKSLPNGARITLGFRNSELGEGSANVSLSITFTFLVEARALYGKAQEPLRINLEIPGKHSGARSIHLGARVAHMFEAFGESVGIALVWAPSAVLKMAAGKIDAPRAEKLMGQITRDLEGSDLRARVTEVTDFQNLLAYDDVAVGGSALSWILTLVKFNRSSIAQQLVLEFAGSI